MIDGPSKVLVDIAQSAGYSNLGAGLLVERRVNVLLAKKALTMCRRRYPADAQFAEAQALYVLGVLDAPPD